MNVTVNGRPREVAEDATLTVVLEQLGFPEQGEGVAVAVDGTVVTRRHWPMTDLRPDTAVEVLTAVQ